MIIGPTDVELHLPKTGATLEEYAEQGRRCGAAYFTWLWSHPEGKRARGEPVDAEQEYLDFHNEYLALLNHKMIAVFNPTEEQFFAFNNAASLALLEAGQANAALWRVLASASERLSKLQLLSTATPVNRI